VSTEVRNLIRHLPPVLKRKVRAALADLLENPTCGKALKEELAGYWSLRVGRTRIVYRRAASNIEIVIIGPGKTSSKKLHEKFLEVSTSNEVTESVGVQQKHHRPLSASSFSNSPCMRTGNLPCLINRSNSSRRKACFILFRVSVEGSQVFSVGEW
jgi:mRNA-degrading endonuclease RelE of RelBE toxin-antitoxin system